MANSKPKKTTKTTSAKTARTAKSAKATKTAKTAAKTTKKTPASRTCCIVESPIYHQVPFWLIILAMTMIVVAAVVMTCATN